MEEWGSSRFFSMAEQYYIDNQNKILDLLTSCDGKLLYISCNNGDFTFKMIERSNCSPYGMEINEDLAQEALKKNIKVTIADANDKFPFKDNYFDIIVSNQVLEHLRDIDKFFDELHRILKEDGILIISTANIASFHNLGLILLGMQPISFHVSEIQVGNPFYGLETDGHRQVFTTPALKDLARYHNFEVVKVFGTGHYIIPRIISKFISRISPRYCIYIGILLKKV